MFDYVVKPSFFSYFKEMKEIEQKYQKEIDFILNVENVIGYKFKNKNLLFEAFTHKSFVSYLHRKTQIKISSFERLEFLGDAVLSLIVSSNIYHRKDCINENILSKLRSSMVNNENLFEHCKRLKLDLGLLTHLKQENKELFLPDLIEALVGAIFVDGGMKNAKKFILFVLEQDFKLNSKSLKEKNYKQYFLDYCEEKFNFIPQFSYELTEQDNGVSIYKSFVILNGIKLEEAYSLTKRSASARVSKLIVNNWIKTEKLNQLITKKEVS